MPQQRFCTDKANGKWMGVCAGAAEYLDMDVSLLRIGLVVGALFTAVIPCLAAYFLTAWIAPDRASIG